MYYLLSTDSHQFMFWVYVVNQTRWYRHINFTHLRICPTLFYGVVNTIIVIIVVVLSKT